MATVLRLLMYASLTYAIETPVMVLGQKKFSGKIHWKEVAIVSFLVNFTTNLSVNLISLILVRFTGVGLVGYRIAVALLEAAVLMSECFMYNSMWNDRINRGRLVITVTVANIVSFVLGIFITKI